MNKKRKQNEAIMNSETVEGRITRNINFEILRIIAMLMIIMGHSIGHTHILDDMNRTTILYYTVRAIQVFCNVATNVYVMLSGYLLIYSEFKLKRVLTLWSQVLFFSIVGYCIFGILVGRQLSFFKLIKVLLPISGNQYWFMRVYLGMYIFSPFINILVSNLSKKQYEYLLGVCILIFSFWRSFIPFAVTLNSEGGNSIIWFVVLYLFGAYMRLYGILIMGKELSFNQSVGIACANLIFAFLSSILIQCITINVGIGNKGASLFTEFTAFPMLFAAAFILNAFSTCKANEKCNIVFRNIVLLFSSSSLSVYLIHENIYVKQWFWSYININRFAQNTIILLIIMVLPIVIYGLCTLVDKYTWNLINKKLFSS